MNYEEMIEYLLGKHFSDITEWEEEFLQSLNDRLKDHRDLTGKQSEILTELFDKHYEEASL